MAKLPEDFVGCRREVGPSTSESLKAFSNAGRPKMVYVEKLILALAHEHTRERALYHLCKIRMTHEDLALLLWHSFGAMYKLLQEIVAVYPLLSTPNLTDSESNRVCYAVALLECVASHEDTRMLFIKANMPLYLYPFLSNMNKEKPHECLRITSLDVISALMKSNDANIINFLLASEILPKCLICMDVGSQISKLVATTIVEKVLMTDDGLRYCCYYAGRFYAITRALGKMADEFSGKPSGKLLNHIICCYIRLTENPRARYGLGGCLPRKFTETTFIKNLQDDPTTMLSLQKLFNSLSSGDLYQIQPGGKLSI
nr:cell differentiation protein rcd1 isoform X1 [Ziziphus jujuba var. spinosa]